MSAKQIDICICTFQRAHIVQTLESLAALQLEPEWHVHVIVADNDDTPSAQPLVEKAAAALAYPTTYIHAPARNISLARNACLAQATGELLAFIDDDELVSPPWLKALVETQATTAADAVLGPVRAIYPPSAPGWMRRGNFHATMPVWVGATIVTGYTCNVLFNRKSAAFSGLHFELALGKTGGEDTVFLSNLHRRGGVIVFAAEAWVDEPVTPARASLQWLIKRRFRSGQTHALGVEEGSGLKYALLAVLKLCVCLVMAVLCCLKPERCVAWLLRGTLHAGVVARLMGKREAQHYG